MNRKQAVKIAGENLVAAAESANAEWSSSDQWWSMYLAQAGNGNHSVQVVFYQDKNDTSDLDQMDWDIDSYIVEDES